MVPLDLLSPGMRVKIVDRWGAGCYQNDEGKMDKYLGQVVTVLKLESSYALIEEDAEDCPSHLSGHWYWSPSCFDYIVDEEEDFEPASSGEILSLFLEIK